MVDLAMLRRRGLRAYELGRARASTRIALPLAPAVALALCATQERLLCAALGLALFLIAAWLRWRDRAGSDAVTTGLGAGYVPLLAGVLLAQGVFGCELVVCAATAALAGTVAGGWIALRSRSLTHVLSAVLIATLSASLGCLSLGGAELAALAGGLALGLGLGAGRLRARRARR